MARPTHAVSTALSLDFTASSRNLGTASGSPRLAPTAKVGSRNAYSNRVFVVNTSSFIINDYDCGVVLAASLVGSVYEGTASDGRFRVLLEDLADPLVGQHPRQPIGA